MPLFDQVLHKRERTGWLFAFLCVLMVALVVAGVMLRLGIVDDSYISLRYASNLIRGHGLVFNVGERVEGYTNFLWVGALAGLGKLGSDMVWWSKVLGILCGLATVLLLYWFFPLWEEGLGGERGWIYLVAPLCLVANPAFLFWSFSGMETALFSLLLFTAATLFAAELQGKGVFPLSCPVVVLLSLTRPEGVILFPLNLAFLAGTWWKKRGALSRVAVYALTFLFLYGLYFTWRFLYYGSLLPNTFYAKVWGGGIDLIVRGMVYSGKFFLSSPFLFFLLPILSLCLRPRALLRNYLLCIVGVLTLATCCVGGDHLSLFRFFVPLVPILALLAQIGLIDALHWGRKRLGHAAEKKGILITVSLVVLAFIGVSSLFTFGIGDGRRFLQEVRLTRKWAAVGRWFGDHAPPGRTLASVVVGAIPFYSDLETIDMLGLTDPHIAMKRVSVGRGYPGHEKYDADYVLAQSPDYIYLVLDNEFHDSRLTEEEYLESVWEEAGRQLVRSPVFRSSYIVASALHEGYLFHYCQKESLSGKDGDFAVR
jgi:hypothetical protein